LNVDMLLASASARDTMASSAPATPVEASPPPDTDEGHWRLTATQAGPALIALGLIFLAGSMVASRLRDSRVSPLHRG
jgi:hypothetical protein